MWLQDPMPGIVFVMGHPLTLSQGTGGLRGREPISPGRGRGQVPIGCCAGAYAWPDQTYFTGPLFIRDQDTGPSTRSKPPNFFVLRNVKKFAGGSRAGASGQPQTKCPLYAKLISRRRGYTSIFSPRFTKQAKKFGSIGDNKFIVPCIV